MKIDHFSEVFVFHLMECFLHLRSYDTATSCKLHLLYFDAESWTTEGWQMSEQTQYAKKPTN